ncbi:MAG TPA: hypothetical protein VN922_19100, partial [Bacteroidia bacterium]|nr:hypothetical protein [Bacteroidia bacterium]
MKALTKILLTGLLLICGMEQMHAGVIKLHKRIQSGLNGCSTIPPSTACAAQTVSLPTPYTGDFRDYSVEDIVTLGIDHNSPIYNPDSMQLQVTISITGVDRNNVAITPVTSQVLSVRYTPFTYTTYLDKSAFVFKNAYQYTVTITNISGSINGSPVATLDSLPYNVYLDADVQLQRYYDYADTGLNAPRVYAPDSAIIDCGTKANELNVSWNTQIGAEQYDLEWTFVNDYDSNSITAGNYLSENQLAYNFRFNSTRITTTATNYNITLAYEHGYLVYRVRGVGKDMYNPSIDMTGAWSLADSGGVSSAAPAVFHVMAAHEGDGKDWQYNATFAEEGKKKEVITYYDGSLRSREAVTKMNSDSNVLVGQTIYDFQGRPAVTVLPTPVQFPTCTVGLQPAIHY